MSEFSIEVWLPFPPSVNRIWRYAKGRAILSPQYVEWKKRADAAGYMQRIARFPVLGEYVIDVRLSDAFRRYGDCDNRPKVINDWCQRAQLVVNDRYCLNSSVGWDANIEHDVVVRLRGEIFMSRDDFARHLVELARKRAKKRRPARLQASGY